MSQSLLVREACQRYQLPHRTNQQWPVLFMIMQYCILPTTQIKLIKTLFLFALTSGLIKDKKRIENLQ